MRFLTFGSSSTPWWQQQQKKALMNKTISVHVRYKSLYISLLSSAKQECEMTKFCVAYTTWTTTAKFSHINLKHDFRAIDEPKRSRESQISLVKYNFIVYLASSSSLLKLPNINVTVSITAHVTGNLCLCLRRLSPSPSLSLSTSQWFSFSPSLHWQCSHQRYY